VIRDKTAIVGIGTAFEDLDEEVTLVLFRHVKS
jgi:hypothetical protein